ncbi:tetratricopeptide repeat protein [Actinokineospora inagensis]|uniref:tetratricopeptide repeat protein n=1 Tax=Actinokineospora inagensis TaxID=103730 RepID=UPI00146FAEC6|nr:tetratricopeptide repeat protein [Actinokineospora inagensis]
MNASSHIVQSGVISGDVHLHSSPLPVVVPRQLPLANHWFSGRDTELHALSAAVSAGDHVAVIGTGGVGKTSLVLHWARHNVDLYPDGQLYVDLRGKRAADAVRALLDGLDPDTRTPITSLDAQVGRYRSLLAGRRMLVVLDNVPDEAQMGHLLPGPGDNTALLTSRDRLDGLSASAGLERVKLYPLTQPEAVRLVARRIGADRASREPTALTELVHYCGGLPLALSVAAGRLVTHPSFSIAAVAEELREASTRIDVLATGEPATTLADVLSSSFDSLSSKSRNLLLLIGGAPLPDFSVHSLAALAGTRPEQVLGRIRELERASLVDEHLPGRWQVHDLVRLHAAQHARNTHSATTRLVDHYLHSAIAADRHLDRNREPLTVDPPVRGSLPRTFDDYAGALAWFDTEHPAVVAAQRLAVELGRHRQVWQMSWATHSYWWRMARTQDQVDGWRLALSAAQQLGDPSCTAVAHRLLGSASARSGDVDSTFDHLERALSLFVDLGDVAGQGDVHRTLARTHERAGHLSQALTRAEAALDRYREFGEPHRVADALDLTAWCEAKLGRFADAGTHGTEALDLYERLEDHDGVATALDSLGHLAQLTGKHVEATEYYERALHLLRGRNTFHEAGTLDRLGALYSGLGNVVRARAAWQRALDLFGAQSRHEDGARVRQRLAALGDA